VAFYFQQNIMYDHCRGRSDGMSLKECIMAKTQMILPKYFLPILVLSVSPVPLIQFVNFL